MKLLEEQKVITKIKKVLENPIALLELMGNKNINRNKIPREFVEDGLKALRKSLRLLNKLNRS